MAKKNYSCTELAINRINVKTTKTAKITFAAHRHNVNSGVSKNFEKGAKDNLSASSSFIANAHNEIYAFYTEKTAF